MAKQKGVRRRCNETCTSRCRKHRFEFYIELPPGPDGKRRQITQGGFATAEQASEARDEVKAQHRAGTLPSDDRQRNETLAEYLPRWLDGRESLRDSTRRSYRGHIDKYLAPVPGSQFYPGLGEIRLRDLRKEHVQALFRTIRRLTADAPRPVGPATEGRILSTLQSAIKAAVQDGILSADHTRNVELPRADPPRINPWNAEQFWSFVDRMKAAPPHSAANNLLPLVLVAAGTGMRLGELCGLRWQDLGDGFLVVAQQTQQSEGGTITYGKPKTRSGEDRVVPVVGWVPDVLRDLRRRQAEEKLAFGPDWADSGLVFVHEDGTGLHPMSISTAFTRLARAYQMPAMSFHGLRHITATLLIQAGVPVPIVSMILGHSNSGITERVYKHIVVDQAVNDLVQTAMDKFSRGG